MLRHDHMERWVLFDPQYHTSSWQATGLFDGGQSALDDFRFYHQCNIVCHDLKLPDPKLEYEHTLSLLHIVYPS